MTQPLDICIRGDGIVGRTLALLLARERLRVGLVTASAPATSAVNSAPKADVRAYALNASSKALLESLRCWPEPQHATEVHAMHVKGDEGGEVAFKAAELHVPGLTWIVDVPALENLLAEALKFQPQIEWLPAPQTARLSVVCEGRASQTRAELGVDFAVTPYPQTALAARLHCEKPHGQSAYQWFAPGEILAFLPLGGPGGHEVAIVWSVAHERAQALLAENPAEFCRQLEQASQGTLGRLTLASECGVWPLQMAHADRWTGPCEGGHWVLAGDAAHNVHPLAGQGLNLGLADVQTLAQLLHERAYWRPVDDDKLLRRYERSRKTAALAMGSAMDGLQLLFSSTSSPLQTLRNLGMNGFDRSRQLKQWVARQAMGL